MSFNAIRKNIILTKISEYTVHSGAQSSTLCLLDNFHAPACRSWYGSKYFAKCYQQMTKRKSQQTQFLIFMCFSVYLKCSDEETANLLRTHPDLIQVLSLTSAVNIMVDQTPPVGCAVQTVSAKCETHLMIKVSLSTLCILGNFACFFVFVVCWFFSKSTVLKNSFRNIIRVSNSLAPDQARQNVGPDLGPNCLQRLSADDTRR